MCVPLSMARPWRDHGNRDEAREFLLRSPLDTRDLKGAKALLDEARGLKHLAAVSAPIPA